MINRFEWVVDQCEEQVFDMPPGFVMDKAFYFMFSELEEEICLYEKHFLFD